LVIHEEIKEKAWMHAFIHARGGRRVDRVIQRDPA
jgi:hypothetical protein